jgi:hypothetical protein
MSEQEHVMGTIVAWVSLVTAAAALIYAWLLKQEMDKLTRRLDRYNRALYNASDEIRQLTESLSATKAELRAEIVRSQGKDVFYPEQSIQEVYALHPKAQEVLAAFHIGGCASCAVDTLDTLEKTCRNAGIDVELVIRSLNSLFEAGVNAQDEARRLQLPNIELQW